MHSIDSCLPEEERKTRVKKNDRYNRIRRIISIALLVSSLSLTAVLYIGMFNVADVFNGNYKYVGQTMNGKADGHGRKYTLKDTLIYEGDFVANNYDGDGKFYWTYDISSDDEDIISSIDESEDVKSKVDRVYTTELARLRYEGSFKAGVYEGQGKQYYALKADKEPVLKYEGQFSNGEYNGKGKLYYYADDAEKNVEYISSVYDCNWKDGVQEGNGEHTKYNADGEIVEHYKGGFTNGQYEGIGTWEFKGENYDYYEGQIVFRGLFENGTIVEGVYYRVSGEILSDRRESRNLSKKYPFPEENVWE